MSDSITTPAGLMTDSAPTKPRERQFDPLAIAAGGFFLMAVGFATVPVFARASSETVAPVNSPIQAFGSLSFSL